VILPFLGFAPLSSIKKKKQPKSIRRITPLGTSQNIQAKESNKSKQPDVKQARASKTYFFLTMNTTYIHFNK
jgi:hypothetical protein